MEKKSLVKTLKATKKANVVTAPAKNEGTSTRKTKMKRLGLSGGRASLSDFSFTC